MLVRGLIQILLFSGQDGGSQFFGVIPEES